MRISFIGGKSSVQVVEQEVVIATVILLIKSLSRLGEASVDLVHSNPLQVYLGNERALLLILRGG